MTDIGSKLNLLRLCYNHFAAVVSKLYKGQILISLISTDGNRIVQQCQKSVKCLVKDVEIVDDDGLVIIGDNHEWVEFQVRLVRHSDVVIRFGTFESGLEVFEFRLVGASEDIILQFAEVE